MIDTAGIDLAAGGAAIGIARFPYGKLQLPGVQVDIFFCEENVTASCNLAVHPFYQPVTAGLCTPSGQCNGSADFRE
jgi:hypothetical protein